MLSVDSLRKSRESRASEEKSSDTERRIPLKEDECVGEQDGNECMYVVNGHYSQSEYGERNLIVESIKRMDSKDGSSSEPRYTRLATEISPG